MKEYINLLMGLIAGLSLTFLNNSIVHESLNNIFTLFDPTNFDYIFISGFILRIIIILSGIGVFITITYSCLILRKSLKHCLKKQ
ncbi:MAG: hypothetical protein E6X43_12065 [Peptostreptococcaceae bacterium]|nr:hypothetical protein [Peptostreptococcaceae bacterium]